MSSGNYGCGNGNVVVKRCVSVRTRVLIFVCVEQRTSKTVKKKVIWVDNMIRSR